MPISTQISAGLAALNLQLKAEQQQAMIRHLELIQKWNRSFNLVANSSDQQLVNKHLLDCLAVTPYVRPNAGQRILDVGSGAGFPGIPWAILYPNTRFVLLDSNGKKTRFLFQTKTELQLANVEVENCRLEHYQSPKQIDIVTCRAFASLGNTLEKARHLMTPGTCLLALKGRYPTAELAALPPDCTGAFRHRNSGSRH
jgi:16S rRNA (guanine527-N7)-methyltransferase